MLFRIQTIWLLLAAVSLGLMFAFPIYILSDGQSMNVLNHYFMPIIVAVNIVVLLFSIFKYKQLKSQMYYSLLSILLNIVVLALIFLEIQDTTNVSYSFGAFLPVASTVFAFLAISGIRKDQKTIKDAYQRLR